MLCPPSSNEETLITELWEHGTIGIIEEPGGLRAFFDDSPALEDVLHAFAGRILELRMERQMDPSEFPKQDWEPFVVGKRFWIAPPWTDQHTPTGRICLSSDSPTAFGTGRHESTQLALEALEEHVTNKATVIDIGSGSGILSRAARLLGASRVFSCDVHIDAIVTSKLWLVPNLYMGSADAIRTHAGDVVVANISARVVDALSWDLYRITRPEGILILTGFVRENAPVQFSPVKVTERGDWLCWICRPPATLPTRQVPSSHSHSLQWW